jgi:hypothetical protein
MVIPSLPTFRRHELHRRCRPFFVTLSLIVRLVFLFNHSDASDLANFDYDFDHFDEPVISQSVQSVDLIRSSEDPQRISISLKYLCLA